MGQRIIIIRRIRGISPVSLWRVWGPQAGVGEGGGGPAAAKQRLSSSCPLGVLFLTARLLLVPAIVVIAWLELQQNCTQCGGAKALITSAVGQTQRVSDKDRLVLGVGYSWMI